MLHVLFAFIWVGNLLALTRLMGYHVKEEEVVQLRFARIYRRMYYFVGVPAMVLTVGFGAALFSRLDPEKDSSWLFYKILFVTGLIVCDVICGQSVVSLNQKPDRGRGIQYKIMHGAAGLLLIGILACVYILRG